MANVQISALPAQTDPSAATDLIEIETAGGTSRHTTQADLMRLPNYTVATLPSVNATSPGRQAFATDGLKVGETTGNGTGVPVYDDGTQWRRTSDDSTVST